MLLQHLSLVAALGLAVTVFAAEPVTAPPPPLAEATRSAWRQVESDLPSDPLLHQGTLANGVRYLVLPNQEPHDQVSLRLVIAAGALHERDDESGLAHFVEHMAFRGTREFPKGKMGEVLQRLGIAFGPDSTAFTTHEYTIYHLELPDSRDATLDIALRAFREYADGVTFDPELIELERGVVLSEMATRDTPQLRAAEAHLRLLWPNAPEAKRRVAGTRDSVQRFTREDFVAFYDAWYRPDRLGIIVVGPIDPAKLIPRIDAEFGGLQARGPARPDPSPEPPPCAEPTVGLYQDDATVGLWLGLSHPIPSPLRPNTRAFRVKLQQRALAFAMFQLRLQKLANEPDSVFVGPIASVDSSIRGWELAAVGVNGKIADWKELAAQLETQHRRAFQFGFTAAELAEARKLFGMRYEESVRAAPTRQSTWLAQQLVGTLVYGHTFAHPATWRDDLAGALAEVQLSDCLREFRAAWTARAPTVFAVAHTSMEVTRQQLGEVLNASRSTAVTRPDDVPPPEFRYADFGPPGRVSRHEHLQDLDVHLSEFENRVKLNFKQTAFSAGQVEVRIRVGDGKLSQLKSRPGIDVLADAGLLAGGVGRHTLQELSEILSGHLVRFDFEVGSDAFEFNGYCASRDLELLLRVICAYLTDPAFRPETMRQARAHYGSIVARMTAFAGGAISASAVRDMYSEDTRFGLAGYEDFMSRTVGELRAWVEPQLTSGPVELSIVGDTSWEDARAAVAATLGALAPRQPVTDRTADVPVVLTKRSRAVKIYPTAPDTKQVAIAWFWPVDHVADIHEDRRCHLLASIISDRLRQKLREELGATYSPMVGFTTYDGFPNANFFGFYAEVDPGSTRRVLEILEREMAQLSKDGPAEDEFERAMPPYLRGMTERMRTNAYWGGTVLRDAQQRPSRLAASRDRLADVAAIKRTELVKIARKHLSPKRAFKFATIPKRDDAPR